jgi:hypothetical protein
MVWNNNIDGLLPLSMVWNLRVMDGLLPLFFNGLELNNREGLLPLFFNGLELNNIDGLLLFQGSGT